MNYVIAIPSYKRPKELLQKTIMTLINGQVDTSAIHIFVANREEYDIYKPLFPTLKVIIGELGIRNQRIFISKYFPENQYIVSIDDDVEALNVLDDKKLKVVINIDFFIKQAYDRLITEHLYLWGIYPVNNPFFMKPVVTTKLKFIIGVIHGYINRHNDLLYPNILSESKEDYEQSLLFYKMDGGVVRFNYISAKTKFNAIGGLGKDRHERNHIASVYLKETYPEHITVFNRKKNNMSEVRFKIKRVYINGTKESKESEEACTAKTKTETITTCCC